MINAIDEGMLIYCGPEPNTKGRKLVVNYANFVHMLFKTKPGDRSWDYMHAAAGISGEAGELIDCVKKLWAYNKPLDKEHLKEELGDLLFYIQAIMVMEDLTFNDVLSFNYRKLMKRYPSGYSDQAAQDRADKTMEKPWTSTTRPDVKTPLKEKP